MYPMNERFESDPPALRCNTTLVPVHHLNKNYTYVMVQYPFGLSVYCRAAAAIGLTAPRRRCCRTQRALLLLRSGLAWSSRPPRPHRPSLARLPRLRQRTMLRAQRQVLLPVLYRDAPMKRLRAHPRTCATLPAFSLPLSRCKTISDHRSSHRLPLPHHCHHPPAAWVRSTPRRGHRIRGCHCFACRSSHEYCRRSRTGCAPSSLKLRAPHMTQRQTTGLSFGPASVWACVAEQHHSWEPWL